MIGELIAVILLIIISAAGTASALVGLIMVILCCSPYRNLTRDHTNDVLTVLIFGDRRQREHMKGIARRTPQERAKLSAYERREATSAERQRRDDLMRDAMAILIRYGYSDEGRERLHTVIKDRS